MFEDKKICVVVPAYNEGKMVGEVLDGIPEFVDKIIVIDDKSTDDTLNVCEGRKNLLGNKLIIVKHDVNLGVGASIVSGYKRALIEQLDIIAVMAGDGQMDPTDLPQLLKPILDGEVGYVKGNRLKSKAVREVMPGIRYIGNSLLTLLTKVSSGFWHVMDPQCGYTAITADTIKRIPLDDLYPSYGFPNDMLTMLNVYNIKVTDVPVKPVYGKEVSGIKLHSYIPIVSLLLLRRFIWRLKEKYVVRDFHPLVLFYLSGFIFLPVGILLGLFLVYIKYFSGVILTTPSVVLSALFIIAGLQSLFFGMLFEMEYGRCP